MTSRNPRGKRAKPASEPRATAPDQTDHAELAGRLAAETEGRRRAEEARVLLAEAAELLSSSFDYESTLAQMADLLVPRFADLCSVYVVQEDGSITRHALVRDESNPVWAEMMARFPQRPETPYSVFGVIKSGEPEVRLQITDENLATYAQNEEHLELLRKLGAKSSMMVPMKAWDRVFGALTLTYSDSGRSYRQEDVRLAEEIAHHCAVAIEVGRLHRAERAARLEAEAAERRRSAQFAVSQVLLETASIDTAATKILEPLCTTLGWDAGAVWILDRSADTLRCQATWQRPGADVQTYLAVTAAMGVHPGVGIIGGVLQSGEPAWVPDIREEPGYRRRESVKEHIRSTLLFPVRSDRGVVGVIEMAGCEIMPRDENTIASLRTLGNNIGQFIERRWAADLVRDLSTPILPIGEHLLLVPLIGRLTPARSGQLTGRLLHAIREHRAKAAVIDVTGVAGMDSFVASSLIRTMEAARLIGVRTILTGLSTEVSRTLVELRIDLSTVEAAGDLRSGIEIANAIVGVPEPAAQDSGPSRPEQAPPAREGEPRAERAPAPPGEDAPAGRPRESVPDALGLQYNVPLRRTAVRDASPRVP